MEKPPISTNSEPVVSPQPETPSVTPSPPKFLPPLIATFILLVVIGVIGGFFFAKSLSQPKPSPISPISQISPTPAVDQTVYTEDTRSANWKTYTDPDSTYSIRVPNGWIIDSQWERGTNLPRDQISYTHFGRRDKYLVLNISKLYSSIPEYECKPKGGSPKSLSKISIGGYKTYGAYSIMNLDLDYKETTSYTYCVDAKGKKLRFEFVPQASDNNPQGVQIFYDILSTFKFLE